MKEETNKAAWNIFLYLLKHKKATLNEIIQHYKAREQHTNYAKSKDAMVNKTIIENPDKTLEINYQGDMQILEKDDLREGLICSGFLPKIFTPNMKLRKFTFFEWFNMAGDAANVFSKEAIVNNLSDEQVLNTLHDRIKKEFSR